MRSTGGTGRAIGWLQGNSAGGGGVSNDQCNLMTRAAFCCTLAMPRRPSCARAETGRATSTPHSLLIATCACNRRRNPRGRRSMHCHAYDSQIQDVDCSSWPSNPYKFAKQMMLHRQTPILRYQCDLCVISRHASTLCCPDRRVCCSAELQYRREMVQASCSSVAPSTVAHGCCRSA